MADNMRASRTERDKSGDDLDARGVNVSTSDPEFQRFEDLTRKLVNVPKKDLVLSPVISLSHAVRTLPV